MMHFIIELCLVLSYISSYVIRDYVVSPGLKVTVDLRGVFLGKQYSALCINGKYINLYIIGELI